MEELFLCQKISEYYELMISEDTKSLSFYRYPREIGGNFYHFIN